MHRTEFRMVKLRHGKREETVCKFIQRYLGEVALVTEDTTVDLNRVIERIIEIDNPNFTRDEVSAAAVDYTPESWKGQDIAIRHNPKS